MSTPSRVGIVAWPPATARSFREAGYWEDRTLGSLLSESAHRHADRIAVVDGQTQVTYRELLERADAAATRLRGLGIKPDDRIVVQLPNGWEFIVLMIGCFRAGIIPVMALPAHRAHELQHLAALSQSVAIVVPDRANGYDHQQMALGLREQVAGLDRVFVLGGVPRDGAHDLNRVLAPPGDDGSPELSQVDAWDPSPDSPACFLLSGGTTGLPKLITRTHNDYVCNIRATSAVSEIHAQDVYLVVLPIGHNFPLACPGILGALLLGARVVTVPTPEPTRAFAAIRANAVTVTAVVPAVAQRWIDHQQTTGGDDLASLRVLQVGGSRLPDEYATRVRPVLGCTLQQVFGMAEGLINATRLDDPADVICTTQGRPVHPADEVRILDESGAEVPDGSPGVLWTRGPYTPRGYYAAPEHNARAFLPGGWYGSGDVVVRRPDGNLVVQGRTKDMINRGGEKISAEEVESLVYRMDGVGSVAAVAMPDPVLGERLCLYLVSRGAADIGLADVRAHLSALGVADYKFPDRLEIIPTLPLTPVGKVDKKALRHHITSLLAATPPVPAPTGPPAQTPTRPPTALTTSEEETREHSRH